MALPELLDAPEPIDLAATQDRLHGLARPGRQSLVRDGKQRRSGSGRILSCCESAPCTSGTPAPVRGGRAGFLRRAGRREWAALASAAWRCEPSAPSWHGRERRVPRHPGTGSSVSSHCEAGPRPSSLDNCVTGPLLPMVAGAAVGLLGAMVLNCAFLGNRPVYPQVRPPHAARAASEISRCHRNRGSATSARESISRPFFDSFTWGYRLTSAGKLDLTRRPKE